MGVFWSLQHDPCLIDPFLTDRQEKLPSIGVWGGQASGKARQDAANA